MVEIVEMDRKGRVLIPKRVREPLGIGSGSKLTVEVTNTAVVLKPVNVGVGDNVTQDYDNSGRGRLRRFLSEK